MKLLLVGFERRRSMGYPHLAQVAAALFEHGADYCLFRERGYLDAGTAGWPSRLRRSTRSLARVAVDSMRLMRARITGNYDLVIACDNMAFVVASMLFPRVVLWSFDFMTADPERPSAAGQRMSSSRVGSMLRRNRRLIIQDRDRLELFRKTFLGTSAAMELDVFLLPVSLLRSPARSRRTPQARPTLLQLGGISRTRSHSDLLLDDYQRNSIDYELVFHGYVDAEMSRRIDAAGSRPRVSARVVAPTEVFQVVETCDMGFLAYNSERPDFHYIANASGQLVEFLRCGKPVIAFGRSNLRQLIESERIGVHIDGVSELRDAIRTIAADYEAFSRNCLRLFAERYDLGKRIPPLLDWLATQGRD